MTAINTEKIPYRQVALKSGVDQRTVSKYFKGESVRYDKRLKISKTFLRMKNEANAILLEINK